MNALVNSLVSKEAIAQVATEPKSVVDPEAVEAEDEDEDNEDGFAGERMIDIGIDPIKTSIVDAELKTIFESNNVPYVRNPALINDVGQRIVDELELLIRMLNPESTYRPEWYDPDEEDQTLLAAVITRDDLVGVYRDALSETYDSVSEDIADGIIEYIAGVVSDHESAANEYYAIPKDGE